MYELLFTTENSSNEFLTIEQVKEQLNTYPYVWQSLKKKSSKIKKQKKKNG